LRDDNGRREKKKRHNAFRLAAGQIPWHQRGDPNLTAALPYPMRKPIEIGYPASFGLGASGRRRCDDAMEGRP